MYIDKLEAIKLLENARQVITQLQEWRPDEPGLEHVEEDITSNIVELESSLNKLEKAIEEDPTKVKDENGQWV